MNIDNSNNGLINPTPDRLPLLFLREENNKVNSSNSNNNNSVDIETNVKPYNLIVRVLKCIILTISKINYIILTISDSKFKYTLLSFSIFKSGSIIKIESIKMINKLIYINDFIILNDNNTNNSNSKSDVINDINNLQFHPLCNLKNDLILNNVNNNNKNKRKFNKMNSKNEIIMNVFTEIGINDNNKLLHNSNGKTEKEYIISKYLYNQFLKLNELIMYFKDNNNNNNSSSNNTYDNFTKIFKYFKFTTNSNNIIEPIVFKLLNNNNNNFEKLKIKLLSIYLLSNLNHIESIVLNNNEINEKDVKLELNIKLIYILVLVKIGTNDIIESIDTFYKKSSDKIIYNSILNNIKLKLNNSLFSIKNYILKEIIYNRQFKYIDNNSDNSNNNDIIKVYNQIVLEYKFKVEPELYCDKLKFSINNNFNNPEQLLFNINLNGTTTTGGDGSDNIKIGSYSINPSLTLFKKCFSIYTNGLFDNDIDFDWNDDSQPFKVVAVGKCVQSCLVPLPFEIKKEYLNLIRVGRTLFYSRMPIVIAKEIMKTVEKQSRFNELLNERFNLSNSPYYEGGIQLCIVLKENHSSTAIFDQHITPTKKVEEIIFQVLIAMFTKRTSFLKNTYKYIRTSNSILIYYSFPFRLVEINLKLFKSYEEVLLYSSTSSLSHSTGGLDCLSVLYDGFNVYMLENALHSYNSKLNLVLKSTYLQQQRLSVYGFNNLICKFNPFNLNYNNYNSSKFNGNNFQNLTTFDYNNNNGSSKKLRNFTMLNIRPDDYNHQTVGGTCRKLSDSKISIAESLDPDQLLNPNQFNSISNISWNDDKTMFKEIKSKCLMCGRYRNHDDGYCFLCLDKLYDDDDQISKVNCSFKKIVIFGGSNGYQDKLFEELCMKFRSNSNVYIISPNRHSFSELISKNDFNAKLISSKNYNNQNIIHLTNYIKSIIDSIDILINIDENPLFEFTNVINNLKDICSPTVDDDDNDENIYSIIFDINGMGYHDNNFEFFKSDHINLYDLNSQYSKMDKHILFKGMDDDDEIILIIPSLPIDKFFQKMYNQNIKRIGNNIIKNQITENHISNLIIYSILMFIYLN